MKEVYIVSAVRTPIGSFGGALSGFTAVELGADAITGALEKANIHESGIIDEVYMGNVVSANLGQAPARRAALDAGLSPSVPATLINKVCASGMKAIMLGAQSIMLGFDDVVVAGGMESMSNIPYYAPNTRFGQKFGHGQLLDGLVKDGLWEPEHKFMMGSCADNTAEEMDFSREEQDEYAIRSYKLAAETTEKGWFKDEIIPVKIPQKRGEPFIMDEDEEFNKVNFDKIPKLKPVFNPDGTVTAANASTINDGASALVLVSGTMLKDLNLKPIAKILGFADAAREPIWFTTAPALAIPKALKRAGIEKKSVDFFEINEAFAVVALANMRILELQPEKVNIFGGAVALGHPLGASGARITTTLINVLDKMERQIGVAGICNGGGGASAIVLEKL